MIDHETGPGVHEIRHALEALRSDTARLAPRGAVAVRRRGDRRGAAMRLGAVGATVGVVGATAGTAYAIAEPARPHHPVGVGIASHGSATPTPSPSPGSTAAPTPTPSPTASPGTRRLARRARLNARRARSDARHQRLAQPHGGDGSAGPATPTPSPGQTS